MASASNRKTLEKDILLEAADRNASVEIHCVNRDGERTVVRTRILGIDDDVIVLDRPRADQDVPFTRDSNLDIYFVFREQLYTFTARIVDPHRMFRLANRQLIRAMSVNRSSAVRAGQRRSHFRVSVAVGDPINVTLHEADETLEGAVPIFAMHFTGTLADLSSGGVSIRVDIEALKAFPKDAYVFLGFRIPGEDDPFIFLAQVRQHRTIAEGTAVRIGLEFLPWPSDRALRQHQNILQKFVREVERMQLKRAS